MPATYVSLASTVLGSNQTSVVFSGISSSYTDLVLKVSVRSNNALPTENIGIRLNGDTTSVRYVNIFDYGTNSPSVATQEGPAAFFYAVGSTAVANTFGTAEIYLPTYTTSQPRTFYVHSASQDNVVPATYSNYGSIITYDQTTIISSVTLVPQAGTHFLTNSSFYLYGIKNS